MSAVITPSKHGRSTGVAAIDQGLAWSGFPGSGLTFISSEPGSGGLKLWLSAAARAHSENKPTAWVNSDWLLALPQKAQQTLCLEKLLVVKKPRDEEHLFLILKEMLVTGVFPLIGCHIHRIFLKTHQLLELQELARIYETALVFITTGRPRVHTCFDLVLEYCEKGLLVLRSYQNAFPYYLEGGVHAK